MKNIFVDPKSKFLAYSILECDQKLYNELIKEVDPWRPFNDIAGNPYDHILDFLSKKNIYSLNSISSKNFLNTIDFITDIISEKPLSDTYLYLINPNRIWQEHAILKSLIEKKYFLNEKKEDNYPLDHLWKHAEEDILLLLFNNKINISKKTFLDIMFNKKSKPILKEFINNIFEYDEKYKKELFVYLKKHYNSIINFISSNDIKIEILDYLINQIGFEPLDVTKKNNNALYWAASGGASKNLAFLCEYAKEKLAPSEFENILNNCLKVRIKYNQTQTKNIIEKYLIDLSINTSLTIKKNKIRV
jgi:hypothetical protein